MKVILTIIVILVSLVLLVGIGLWIALTPASVTTNTTSSDEFFDPGFSGPFKTLPNILQENEGSLILVTHGGQKLLFSSSISPMLRPGSPASEEVLSIDSDWLPGPCSQMPHALLGNEYFVHLERALEVPEQYEKAQWTLQIFDLAKRKKLTSIDLADADTVYTERTEWGPIAETTIIPSLTVDAQHKKVLMVLRKNVDQLDPGHGTPKEISTAEIWSVQVPDGAKELLFTVTPEALANNEFEKLQLPYDVLPIGDDFFLLWPQRVERVDGASKERTVLLSREDSTWTYSATRSPDGSRLIIFDGNETPGEVGFAFGKTTVYELRAGEQELTRITDLSGVHFASTVYGSSFASWNSTGDELLLLQQGEQAGIVRLNLAARKFFEYEVPKEAILNETLTFSHWLPSGKVLIKWYDVEGSNNPEELPQTEVNYLEPIGLWDLEKNTVTKLGNYRNELFLGVF